MPIELQVTGMTADGAGVARNAGKVVFVPGALVGETVAAEIVGTGARVDRARLVSVLAPAGRRPSPCRHDHAGGCGGCSLLFGTREAQAAAKRTIVADALARIAGVDPGCVAPAEMPGPEFGYRNHARFGVDADGLLTYVARPLEGSRLGRRAAIAIDTCVVLDERIDAMRAALAGKVAGVAEVELRLGASTGDLLVVLRGATRLPPDVDPTKISASIALESEGSFVPVRGFPWVHEEVLGRRFRVSADAFFQVNTAGAACLAALVREAAGVGASTRALDLYCGVGLFAGTALSGAARVVGVELDEAACSDFRVNVPTALLRPEPVADVLRAFVPGRDVFDVIIANPPRAGIGAPAIRALGMLRAPRLVVVSCDPGSLARDVAGFLREGYGVRSVVPVDQFPGTPHVESVVVLELSG